jgi:hypothetical protein
MASAVVGKKLAGRALVTEEEKASVLFDGWDMVDGIGWFLDGG